MIKVGKMKEQKKSPHVITVYSAFVVCDAQIHVTSCGVVAIATGDPAHDSGSGACAHVAMRTAVAVTRCFIGQVRQKMMSVSCEEVFKMACSRNSGFNVP